MSFLKDRRKVQEMVTRPLWRRAIKSVFPPIDNIRWINQDDEDFQLDKKRSVDVTIRFPNESLLYGQVKSLSYKYSGFRTLTVEYYDDPQTGEKGDWFSLGSHFYCCGFCTQKLQDKVEKCQRRIRSYEGNIDDYFRRLIEEYGIDCLTVDQAFDSWIIVNWTELVLKTQRGLIKWRTNKNESRGKADFKFCKMEDIPRDCVIGGNYEHGEDLLDNVDLTLDNNMGGGWKAEEEFPQVRLF